MHNSVIIAVDLVRYTIDLDPVVQSLSGRDYMETLPKNTEPVLKRAQRSNFNIKMR